MGTRAIVLVPGAECQLYHHWDGYPSNMLQVLEKGRRASRIFNPLDGTEHRAPTAPSKVAAAVCAGDASGFDIELLQEAPDGNHGDLEWVYHVRADWGRPNGCRKPRAVWLVDIFEGDGRHKVATVTLAGLTSLGALGRHGELIQNGGGQ